MRGGWGLLGGDVDSPDDVERDEEDPQHEGHVADVEQELEEPWRGGEGRGGRGKEGEGRGGEGRGGKKGGRGKEIGKGSGKEREKGKRERRE